MKELIPRLQLVSADQESSECTLLFTQAHLTVRKIKYLFKPSYTLWVGLDNLERFLPTSTVLCFSFRSCAAMVLAGAVQDRLVKTNMQIGKSPRC